MSQDVPISSLRQFLLPSQILAVKVFEAATVEGLETEVNRWLDETKNIVVVCGPIHRADAAASLSMPVTYVPATRQ